MKCLQACINHHTTAMPIAERHAAWSPRPVPGPVHIGARGSSRTCGQVYPHPSRAHSQVLRHAQWANPWHRHQCQEESHQNFQRHLHWAAGFQQDSRNVCENDSESERRGRNQGMSVWFRQHAGARMCVCCVCAFMKIIVWECCICLVLINLFVLRRVFWYSFRDISVSSF